MNYKELLETERNCPFCEFGNHNVIKKIREAVLTYALAPYCKHHLLVTTGRHIESFEDLTSDEKKDIDDILLEGVKFLKALGHESYSILLRNGKKAGKTIEHLHYHIIPSTEVGSLSNNNIDRELMTEEEIDKLLEDFKNLGLDN
ncbi:MAG: HIT domain-containing protein [Candidatus Pacebacteria bacterium]|nr:HIT domain-containing protein [Candidatus Paceibacterota bacterium]